MKAKQFSAKKAAQFALSRANELKRAGAQMAGSHRTDVFYDKWRAAMTSIEQEVIGNNGIYPHNMGKLNLTEVARRAGGVVNSLYPARHTDFKVEIEDFVERMTELAPVKKPVASPAAPTWEELYKATVTNYQADALLWRSDRARRETAEKQVEELEVSLARHQATIDQLVQQLAELTKGRVVPIATKKGDR